MASLNDASFAEQSSVGEQEAQLLQTAAREGVPPVAVQEIATALSADGVVQVETLLSIAAAKDLLVHVNKALGRQRESDQRHDQDPHKEVMLGAVLCRQHRFDLKLDLREPIVGEALANILSLVGPSLLQLLGSRAELFELGALISDGGSTQQPLHPDTPWTRAISVITVIVALQDVDQSMGPTIYLPRTHTQRARAAMWGFDPKGDEDIAEVLAESTLRIPLPRCGDGVLFDSRTMHCGGANESNRRRVLFYFSFKRRPSRLSSILERVPLMRFLPGGWRGGGFDQPGTLLDDLRNAHCLSVDGRRLVEGAKRPRSGPPSVRTAASGWATARGVYVATLVCSRLATLLALLLRSAASPWPACLFSAARPPMRLQQDTSWRMCGISKKSAPVFEPLDSRSRFERVVVLTDLVPDELCQRLTRHVDQPHLQSSWRSDRHHENPTTDLEVDDGSESGGVLAWFDSELEAMATIDTVVDEIVRTYGVAREHLLLREMFVVRYCAGSRCGERDGLEDHRDASWFSFVVALNQPGKDFQGGGTVLRGRGPVLLRRGECLLFVGQQLHGAAPIAQGTRICLTGFVDLRAPLAVRDSCTLQMRRFDAGFVCSSCRSIERPYLRWNIKALQRQAKGLHGKALLHVLAARRLAIPHLELEELEAGCRLYLAAVSATASGEGGDFAAGDRQIPSRVRAFIHRVLVHVAAPTHRTPEPRTREGTRIVADL
jgi:ectoine hydroxylase-related dioxygenase (phytanoyl-CoA dioxygenase family)